jgi:hypothetical protein
MPGHAHHVGTVALQPVDLGGGFQARALGGRIHRAIADLQADRHRRIAEFPAPAWIVGLGEVDVPDSAI